MGFPRSAFGQEFRAADVVAAPVSGPKQNLAIPAPCRPDLAVCDDGTG
ncbi:protein of unassigned function [Methylobacterium oryzae CBMB20]|uniref:Protein of unassigned function n=1 Tax=Methylobacterium oryzae CBMB20 TaxID=693986 RepID=A0A089QFR1_9HYPH|nr:protein of unassigned function [Methylobacterium oryzae CBMB20]